MSLLLSVLGFAAGFLDDAATAGLAEPPFLDFFVRSSMTSGFSFLYWLNENTKSPLSTYPVMTAWNL